MHGTVVREWLKTRLWSNMEPRTCAPAALASLCQQPLFPSLSERSAWRRPSSDMGAKSYTRARLKQKSYWPGSDILQMNPSRDSENTCTTLARERGEGTSVWAYTQMAYELVM